MEMYDIGEEEARGCLTGWVDHADAGSVEMGPGEELGERIAADAIIGVYPTLAHEMAHAFWHREGRFMPA